MSQKLPGVLWTGRDMKEWDLCFIGSQAVDGNKCKKPLKKREKIKGEMCC